MDSPGILIDLTRLVSRQGRRMTGVDRVEHAWASQLAGAASLVWGLVRTRLGFVLLDRSGIAEVVRHAEGLVAGERADILGWLCWPGSPARGLAETSLRRCALARAPRWRLARLLKMLPRGFCYLNIGHANIDSRVMRAIHDVDGARIAVLLHDVIPLDHPDMTRPGTATVFARKVETIARHADLVIHTAQATRTANEVQLERFGRVPPGLVAHPGVPLRVSTANTAGRIAALPPYFVALGTIEPRKNHTLLLDLWERMHATLPEDRIPHLHIVGARGWADTALLARLDSAPFRGGTMFEHSDASDSDVAALMAGASALLFPSHAEGFGFPPMEAARDGVPVICTPLPVLREMLGNTPIYRDAADLGGWMAAILTRAHDGPLPRTVPPVLPTWADHFNAVLTRI